MSPAADDHNDAERDAWLRAALRHAPDAEVGAPAALSAAIMRQARQATARTAPPAHHGLVQRLLAGWSWLARPPVAAGFASVMVATVVGLMGWDRPLDEALPRAPANAPTAAAAPATTAPGNAAITAAATATVTVTAAVPAVTPAPTVAPAAAPAMKSAAPSARAERERERTAPVAASRRAAAAAPHEERAVLADAAPAPPDKPPHTPPPAAPAVVAEAPVAEAARITAAPAAPRPAAGSTLQLSRALKPNPPLAPASLLGEVREALRQEPQRWTWQRGDGPEQAMTPAMQAWLARVDRETAGAAPAAAPSATPAGDAPTLRLLRDGRLHTMLTLGDTSLGIAPADASRAPLPSALGAPAAAALKSALDDAAH